MKIIAGMLGGRRFRAPKGTRTHPMSEKVKGALFNSLGDLAGKEVLDAFAGSGALSFEALSRGADYAVAIEIDKNAYRTMQENIIGLGLEDKCKTIRANVSGWSDNNPQQTFALVIFDPPYDKLSIKLIFKLTRHLKTDGRLVISLPGKLAPLELEGLKLTEKKKYGDAQLLFYDRYAS